MTFEKCKSLCQVLREFFGNTSIDIQGGGPTIHPEILELISYCRGIGLYPTLITNGLHLSKPGVLEEFRDAGIRDFLVSYHGIGDIHDQVVCKKGAYEKMDEGRAAYGGAGHPIPIQLHHVEACRAAPARHRAQGRRVRRERGELHCLQPLRGPETGIRTHDNVPRYSDIKPKLADAIDILEAAGIEANVRYLPLCMAEKRHRKDFYNFQQLPYDHHEWDYQSWLWTGMQPQRVKDGGFSPTYRLGPWDRRIYVGNAYDQRETYQQNPLLEQAQVWRAARPGTAAAGRFAGRTPCTARRPSTAPGMTSNIATTRPAEVRGPWHLRRLPRRLRRPLQHGRSRADPRHLRHPRPALLHPRPGETGRGGNESWAL